MDDDELAELVDAGAFLVSVLGGESVSTLGLSKYLTSVLLDEFAEPELVSVFGEDGGGVVAAAGNLGDPAGVLNTLATECDEAPRLKAGVPLELGF